MELFSHACGSCAACTSGWSAWCECPAVSQPLCFVPETLGLPRASRLLMAVSAFMSATVNDDAIVVAAVTSGDETLVDLLRLVHWGSVFAANDLRDAALKKQLLALTRTGRADVIVSLDGGRDAVMAVKRGGTVCLPEAVLNMPTITELAQREVRMVGPRDMAALVDKVGRHSVEMAFARRRSESLLT